MKRILLSALVSMGFSLSAFAQAPIANSQTITIVEDSYWTSIVLTGSDPDSDPITFTVITMPPIGALGGTEPNMAYLPPADFSGTTSFQFVTNDGTQNSAPATVTIIVQPVNDPPVANPQSVNTLEDTPLPVTLTGADVEGDALSFTVITGPSHGVLTGTAPNLLYIPSANYNGTDSFTFRTADPNGGISPIATVTITVTAVNDPPVANCMNLTGYLTGSGVFNIVPPMLNNGSTDDNAIVSMSVSPNQLTCANLGPNNVTLTVFDAEGLSSSCIGVVTVLDSVHPVITSCPGAQTISITSGCSGIVPDYTSLVAATDNCGSVTITQVSPLPGASLGIGISTPVTIEVADGSGNTRTCVFNTVVSAPEIDIRGNGISITDGDNTSSVSDDTDFGNVNTCTGSVTHTFTIETMNPGFGLSGISVTLIGMVGDFTVTVPPPNFIVWVQHTATFDITFNPQSSGFSNAVVIVSSNDCDENPYTFTISGTGYDSEMNVRGNLVSIVNGDNTPSTADHTDFGNTRVCTGSFLRTFTIQNTGDAPLTVGPITITGTHASDFSVVASPPALIAPLGVANLIIQFDPSAAGLRNATITIANDDCDENPYTFAVSGFGDDPEINVQGNSVTIPDGDVTPTTADYTDFGSVLVCSGTINRLFMFQNTGNSTLWIGGSSSLSITGANAGDFTAIGFPPTTIAAGGVGGFMIQFNPSAPGLRTATISITSDDCDENPYTFAISGFGEDPEVNVLGNGITIPDGDVTPTTADHSDFGSVLTCSGTIIRTFTLQNTGNATLNAGAVTVTGVNASDFVVYSVSFLPVIAPGGSGTFQIRFDPTAVGLRTAIINIGNDDCDESPYNFTVQGTGNADIVNPVANCQNITLQLNAAGTASIIPAMIDNGSTDNCGIASMSVNPTGFSCANVGANNVTLTVTDNSGNSSSCTAIVTVADTVRPVVSCPNSTVYLDASGNGFPIPVVPSDNCGVSGYNVSPNSFSCSNVGPNNVTMTVTDVHGNISVCTSTVTVLDTVRPTANTQNISLYLNASGNASLTAAMINNGSSDACGITSMTVVPSSFTCANVGANTVTFTVTDVNGNTRSSNAIVTVIDTVAPAAFCRNFTAYLNASGTVTPGPSSINNGSNDPCGIMSYTVTPATFTCANVGNNNVTLTVFDQYGNSSSCSSIMTVVDTVRPVVVTQNISVYLDATGFGSITPLMLNNGSSDACGIGGMSVAPNVFGCSAVGANNVVLTVTDVNGNTKNGNAIVTIIDTVRPVAIAQNITVTLSGGTASITAAMINNGSSDACGVATWSVTPSAFTCANLGVNTVILTITDFNGNSDTASAVVTVLSDFTSSVAVNSNVSCFAGSNGQATATHTGGAGPFTYAWLPSGGNGAVAAGLTAGTYTCTITDGGGCTTSSTVAITEPVSALTASATYGSINCNGGSTLVTVTASGGTAPYTGTSSFTVTAGTYTQTVVDANGCMTSTSFTVTEPSVLAATSSATSISCNGGTAIVTVAATGGIASYSGTGTFTVTAGTYSYTVTDANGCTASTSITFTEPAVLAATSSATSISCNGGTAVVTVSATGGTSAYTGTGTFTVTAGTYSYTVTDANGCSASTSITVTEPAVLAATSSATPILCNGGNSTVTVTGSGGTFPYSGEGTFTAMAGTHSYTVTDANGCAATTSITITEPTVLAASSSATSILCNGGTATVTVTGSGGTFPYNGEGTFTAMAGTHSYAVTDANGCTATTSITITEPSAISTTVTFTNLLCNGDSSGSIDLTVSGGTAPYTFDWNNGAYTSEDLSGLAAGTYTGVLTDANGCTDSGTITLTEPAILSVVVATANGPSTCGGSDGAIDITVAGGTSGYTFLWNTSATSEDISGISAGTYSCAVTDTNGCSANASVTLSDPVGPVVQLTLVTDTICLSDGAFTLTGESPAGGTFSGPGVNAGLFYADSAGIGSHYITYTFTDVNGCTGSATDSLNVDACLTVVTPEARTFNVYPNPNNGTFIIQLNTSSAANVLIYDVQGKLVSERCVQPAVQEQISIGEAGLYMVTVITADGQQYKQRVIVAQ